MASNQGNYDNSANVPLWTATSVFKAPTAVNAAALYEDTTPNDQIAGVTVGVFGVDDNEILVDGSKGAHAGWILRTVGSGGRAGRVTEETLSVVAKFRTDNNSDDAVYPDASITISTQPSRAIVRANTANANSASFSVSVAAQPVGGTVSYVWQYNNASGSYGWANVLNGAGTYIANTTITGNTSSTLTVTPSDVNDANTFVFRVVATSTPPAGITNATAVSVTSSNAQIIILPA
jgi:hypothetical protein